MGQPSFPEREDLAGPGQHTGVGDVARDGEAQVCEQTTVGEGAEAAIPHHAGRALGFESRRADEAGLEADPAGVEPKRPYVAVAVERVDEAAADFEPAGAVP